ncbi:hypothetical protein VTO42DRAFT_6912 [Malbranchea cinnamomea]
MNGSMVEAKEGVAWLQLVDENTFSNFVEFVYTGDYSEPDPSVDASVFSKDEPERKRRNHHRNTRRWDDYTAVDACHLRDIFTETHFYPERFGDIVELIRYSFRWTFQSENDALCQFDVCQDYCGAFCSVC